MFNVSTKISMQFLGEFIFRVFILAYNPTKAFECLYLLNAYIIADFLACNSPK